MQIRLPKSTPLFLICAIWIFSSNALFAKSDSKTLYELGMDALKEGECAKAESFLRRAVRLAEKEDLGGLQGTMSCGTLDIVFLNQSKYAEAEALYKHQIALCERKFGADDEKVAYNLRGLAFVYELEHKYADSEALYKRVISIFDRSLGDKFTDLLKNQTIETLAKLYCKQGRYSDAEPLFKDLLTAAEASKQSEAITHALEQLGSLYGNEERYEEAEQLLRRAVRIDVDTKEAQTWLIADHLVSLANVLFKRGKCSEAEGLYMHALEVDKKISDEKIYEGANHVQGLAALYSKQDDYSKAESYYRLALLKYQLMNEWSKLDIAIATSGLAYCYVRQGKWAEAHQACAKLQKDCNTILAFGHKAASPDATSVGDILQRQAKYATLAVSLENLADVYGDRRKYSESKPLYLLAIGLYKSESSFNSVPLKKCKQAYARSVLKEKVPY